MYRPDDLRNRQFDEVLESLRSSRRWTVSAVMHDLDDKPYRKLGTILDGQVDGNGSGRALEVSIHDPKRRMRDVEGLNSGKYIIQPRYEVEIESEDRPVVIPVGSFAIDTCERDDEVVVIKGRGKGVLHMKAPGDPFVVPKGIKLTEALMRVAVQAGELRPRMDVPDLPKRLNGAFTVGADQGYWSREQDLAGQIGRLLFYAQDGRYTLREQHTAPSFTFRMGRSGFLTKMPVVKVANDDFFNEIHFRYGDAAKTTLAQGNLVVVEADPSHPLSAQSLKWHDSPRRVIAPEIFEHGVKRRETARRLARQMLDRSLLHTVSVTAECYPFPFIEPGDLYRFISLDYSDVTSITSWTLPLSPGNSMTLGWSDVRSRGASR